MSMKPYFEKKLGNTWKRWLRKGRDRGGRLGKFHLIKVTDENLTFSVSSYRVCPSGIKSGGSDRRHGEIEVEMGDGLDDTLDRAVATAKNR